MARCYTEKASPTRHRPERQHNARANRRKQCSPNETKSYSKPTLPRKRQTTPTNGHTPRCWKPTHTRLTYTRMRPHAPSHQAGDHPVPAHTERVNPPRLRTQRQSGLPPRAASSQVGLVCLMRGCIVLEFGLHCFMRLSHALCCCSGRCLASVAFFV